MKKMVSLALSLLLVLPLAACSNPFAAKTEESMAPQSSAMVQDDMGKKDEMADKDMAEQKVHGIINRMDEYLVLLTDDGEYQVMDLGEGVTLDGFAEGDSVNVTFTGKLGVESETPVVTAIVKADA